MPSKEIRHFHNQTNIMTLVSQEHKKKSNQKEKNISKVQADGKLVGEINLDNFANESDFIPNVKTEIKQEDSEELPFLATNVQSLDEPPRQKEEELPLDESDANKPQSDGSNTISNSENAPIRHGPKEFGCPFCPKLLEKSATMKLHIMAHTGEKPFECNNCRKKFSQKSSLDSHELANHGDKPFECNDCGKRFYQKVHLKHHRLRQMC